MDIVKCPRCGEEYSNSYRSCPFCEEEDYPRKAKNRMKSGHRVTEKKKTYSGRGALIVILLLVLALLTWVLFGEKLVERFAKPEEPEPPVEDVTTPPVVNEDPFYDPSVGEAEGTDAVDPDAAEPPVVDQPSVNENMDASNAVLSSKDFTLKVGESTQLSVAGTNAEVIWSSKDSAVAVVGNSGLVTAINPGTTTITATVGDTKTKLEAIARVKSTDAAPNTNGDALNAKLSSEDFTASVGESVTLRVTGTSASVTWSIDDSGIASVSSSGVVKGVKAGQTKVHAKVGDKTLTCVVRIK